MADLRMSADARSELWMRAAKPMAQAAITDALAKARLEIDKVTEYKCHSAADAQARFLFS